MKKQDQLFELIKSLSKGEKRYFKLFASIHSGESKYMKLFEAIHKMDTYSEATIVKKFKGETFLKQLGVTKNYLFNLILKSIKNYASKSDSFKEKVEEKMQAAAILHRKGLVDLAEKQLAKIRIPVQEDNDFELAIRLGFADWERALSKDAPDLMSSFEENELMVKEALKKQRNFWEMARLWGQYHMLIVDSQVARNEEDKAKMQQIIDHPLFQNEELILSEKARDVRNATIIGAYEFVGNYEKAYQVDKVFTTNYLKRYDKLHIENPIRYLYAIRNYLQSCSSVKDWEEFRVWLEKMKQVDVSSKLIEVNLFALYTERKLGMLVHSGQHEEALRYIASFESDLAKYESDMRGDIVVSIQIYMGLANFYMENYNEALTYFNELILDKRFQQQPYMISNARLLRLLCYYELDLRSFLISEVRSYYRYLYQYQKAYKFEFLLLKIMRDVVKTYNKQEMNEVLSKYRPQVEALKNNIYEKNAFALFDFELWMSSKISRKTMPIIVKENLMSKSA